MPKFQFLFDIGGPSMDFVVAKAPTFVFDFSNYDICFNHTQANTQITFVIENRPRIIFEANPDAKRQCGTMYLRDVKKRRLRFDMDTNKPTFSFCVEQRPQLLFECSDSSGFVTQHDFQIIQFDINRTIRLPFTIHNDAKHHCGTMYVGHRFNDDLVTSSVQRQILSLHGCVAAMSSNMRIVPKDITMDLLHYGYRDITLGDWDGYILGKIDQEALGAHVFGKVHVNVTSSYPDSWCLLADKDGNVLATAENEVLVVDNWCMLADKDGNVLATVENEVLVVGS